jgi:putative inorganic carbon (hco3(-)) transporter
MTDVLAAPAPTWPGIALEPPLEQVPPAITSAQPVTGTVLVVVGLCSSVFSGEWHQIGLPPMDRALLVLGLAWYWLGFDGGAALRHIRWRPIHWLMVAALGYAVASGLLVGSLTDKTSVLQLVDVFGLLPYLLFVSAPFVFGTDRQRNLLLVGLVVLGIYLSVTAVFEVAKLHSWVYPRYIVTLDPTVQPGRARGPMIEAAANGASMFACGVAAVLAKARWRRRLSKLVAGATVVLCLFGTFLTLTRAVWLAAIAAVLVVGAIDARVRRFVLALLLLAPIALAIALVASPTLRGDSQSRISDEWSIWDRQNIDGAALRMFEAHPIVGVGWHEFEPKSPPYFRLASTYPLTGFDRDVHNVPLARAAELGLVGAGLWLAALVGAVIAGARAGPASARPWRLAFIAIVTCCLIAMQFAPFTQPFPNLILWGTAGIAAAMPESAVMQ